MDFEKELAKYPDLEPTDKAELEQLAAMQKDVAVGGSAEDFIRHPFFKSFENKMNEMINDSKNKILDLESPEDLKAFQASIRAIKELKGWLNAHVMKGRVAAQAIAVYENDTEKINQRIQEAIDKAQQ